MDRKTAINIINNYSGVYSKKFFNKDEFSQVIVSSKINVNDEISALIISKEWGQFSDYGLVKYKLLGKIKIV